MRAPVDTHPYWSDSATIPFFPKLDRDLDVDVLIVGGGITGLTAAYLLSGAGKSVALVERDRLAQVDTGHTSAHLTMVTDRRFSDLSSSLGQERARAAWDAGLAAVAQIADIVHAHDIACDFAWVPGYVHAARGDGRGQTISFFEHEAQRAAAAGFDAAFVGDVPLVGGAGVRFGNQARFHPRKYLAAIANVVVQRGGSIFEQTAVETVESSPLSVRAGGHAIRCGYVVIATHNPLQGNTSAAAAAVLQTKLSLYTSYVVAGRVPKGSMPDALMWDTADPYHYLRLEPHDDFDVVIFGGEDHKTGQIDDPEQCYLALEHQLATLFVGVTITHRWSGQVIDSIDGLPYIGETAPRQFAGTGYGGNGMTFGTFAGMMAADRVLGRANAWADLFDPERISLTAGAWKYVRENVDYPYHMIRDRVARMAGLVKPAPVCTHMGCLTVWNAVEETWDCPCHGSRFKRDGAVISGPAERPLKIE